MQNNNELSQRTVVMLGFLVYFFSYAMRLDYSATLVAIVSDLKISNTMASAAVTGSFITYGIAQAFCGIVGDKISPIKMISVAMIGTIIVNVLVSFCSNIAIITILWSINGVCQAMIWPPLARFVLENVKKEKYADSITIVGLSASIGTMFVYLFVPFVLKITVWRNVFRFMSLFGVIIWLVWNYMTRNVSMGKADVTVSGPNDKKNSVLKFAALAGLAPIFIAIVFQGVLRDGIQTWLPSLVNEKLGLSASSSILSTAILPILSIVSVISANMVYHKTNNEMKAASMMFGVSFAATVPLALGLKMPAVVTIVLASLVAGCMHGVNHTLVSLLPKNFAKYGMLATFSGINNSFTYVGASISSYGFAALSDGIGWNAVLISCCASAGLGTLTCLLKIKSWTKFCG